MKELIGKYLEDDEDMKDLNLTAKQADGLARTMTLQVPPSAPPITKPMPKPSTPLHTRAKAVALCLCLIMRCCWVSSPACMRMTGSVEHMCPNRHAGAHHCTQARGHVCPPPLLPTSCGVYSPTPCRIRKSRQSLEGYVCS